MADAPVGRAFGHADGGFGLNLGVTPAWRVLPPGLGLGLGLGLGQTSVRAAAALRAGRDAESGHSAHPLSSRMFLGSVHAAEHAPSA